MAGKPNRFPAAGESPVPARIATLAARQHGVVSRTQLRALGIGRHQVQGRLAAGHLIRLHRGVYAVGHDALTYRARLMAASLAAGPEALISHRSAAALWGIGTPRFPIEISRPGPGRYPGLRVYRIRTLGRDEVLHFGAIPATSVARTLLDLCSVLSVRELDDCFSTVRRLSLLDPAAVRASLALVPNRKGTARLRRFLDSLEGAQRATRSELESRFLQLCDRAGIPRPEVDVPLGGRVIDFLWRRQALIAEVDGFSFHHHRFDEDRRRDLEHLVAGYRTIRITYRMIEEDPRGLADSIKRLLAAESRVIGTESAAQSGNSRAI